MHPRTGEAAPGTLNGRWLLAARVVWVILAVMVAGVFVSGIPSEFARLQAACTGAASCGWVPRLTAENVRGLEEMGLSTTFFAAYFVTIEVVFTALSSAIGATIFWRRADDRMAFLVSLMLLTLGAALTVPYPLLDLPLIWELSAEAVSFVGVTSLILFLYLFPNGRFVPRWTRWLTVVWIFGFMVPATFFYDLLLGLFGYLVLALVAAGFVSTTVFAQVYRYRWVSGPAERRQTRWVVFGIVVALGGSCALSVLDLVVPAGVLTSMAGNTALFFLVLLIPASLVVAVLSSGLFDIDVVINRALVYGSLTGALTSIYAGCVALLQYVLGGLTGGESQVAIVASTLTVAALFNPLRRRVQAFVDRRFYRTKYDAAQILASFSATLRDETDLDALGDDLVGVVRETVQPEHASLWLRAVGDGDTTPAPRGEVENGHERGAYSVGGSDT